MATVALPIALSPHVTTNVGNCGPAILSLTAWDAAILSFVKDVDGQADGTVVIPPNLAGTPAAKIKLYLTANATSGVTRLTVAVKSVADGVTVNPGSFTAETAQDITVPATARLLKVVTFPASGSLSETLAASSLLQVTVTHNGAHANDTLAVATELLAATLVCDVA